MSTEGEARHIQMRVCGDGDTWKIFWRATTERCPPYKEIMRRASRCENRRECRGVKRSKKGEINLFSIIKPIAIFLQI